MLSSQKVSLVFSLDSVKGRNSDAGLIWCPRCRRPWTLRLGPAPGHGPDPGRTPGPTQGAAPAQDPGSAVIGKSMFLFFSLFDQMKNPSLVVERSTSEIIQKFVTRCFLLSPSSLCMNIVPVWEEHFASARSHSRKTLCHVDVILICSLQSVSHLMWRWRRCCLVMWMRLSFPRWLLRFFFIFKLNKESRASVDLPPPSLSGAEQVVSSAPSRYVRPSCLWMSFYLHGCTVHHWAYPLEMCRGRSRGFSLYPCSFLYLIYSLILQIYL